MKRIKKVAYFLLYCIFGIMFLFTLSEDSIRVSQSTDKYAKVVDNGVVLYRSPNDKLDNNTFFCIDNSYFVRLIKEYDERYYKVEYNGIVGYIKTEQISVINETPINPFVLASMYANNNVKLYKESDKSSEIVIDLPQNIELKYIGKITGKNENSYLGNVWYYVQVEIQNVLHFGYVYSGDIHALSAIDLNTESTTNYKTSKLSDESLLNLNLSAQTIMIIVTIIPTFILVIGLLKGSKINVENT